MITFTYTKESGDVSERVACVVSKPKPNYLMIDCTQLSEAERDVVEEIVLEYNEAMSAAWSNLQSQLPKPGLIKSFKTEGVANLAGVV